MSKCVLVIDMPSSCNDCICRFVNIAGKTICKAKIEELKPKSDKRPDWCPLRELPNPKEKGKAENILEIFSNAGYNACIDELLKGEEG